MDEAKPNCQADSYLYLHTKDSLDPPVADLPSMCGVCIGRHVPPNQACSGGAALTFCGDPNHITTLVLIP